MKTRSNSRHYVWLMFAPWFVLLTGCWSPPSAQMIPFNPESWKREIGSDGKSSRILMLDDLKSKYHLVGMRRIEVIELLGDPSRDYPKDEIGENDIAYFIGRDTGFGIDFVYLIFRCDENQVVTKLDLDLR